ncbi:MAG: hypothetical protein ABIH82_05830, partial [Candidatus Woesearchaeota archaeon]
NLVTCENSDTSDSCLEETTAACANGCDTTTNTCNVAPGCTDECTTAGAVCSGANLVTCENSDITDTCLEETTTTCANGCDATTNTCNVAPGCTDTCTSLNYACGNFDVCGTLTNCGPCLTGTTCNAVGQCVADAPGTASLCTPSCSGDTPLCEQDASGAYSCVAVDSRERLVSGINDALDGRDTGESNFSIISRIANFIRNFFAHTS